MPVDPPVLVDMEDVLITFQFGLELGGMINGYFQSVSGIGSYHEIAESHLVDDRGHAFIKKVPGILKDDDVVLKRGITSNLEIWEWRAAAERGDMQKARRNCSIIMFSRTFEAIARWDFVGAWPSKVSGPEFSSDGSEFGVEEVTLVHEGFGRVQ